MDQPLRQALAMMVPLREKLVPLLEYQPHDDMVATRGSYCPQCFVSDGESADGERVLLVEDTWVTGGTAISAAGALANMGAKSIMVMPIARVLDTGYWNSSPYVQWVNDDSRRQYDNNVWSR